MPEEKDERVRKYQIAVQTVGTAGWMVATHDVPGLLAAIATAETTGPVLDPTLYRKQSESMALDKELLEAALPLWKLARKRLGQEQDAAWRPDGR